MIYIVEDVMVHEVISVLGNVTVKYAASQMTRLEIGCLVITEGSNVVGIVTERDILVKIVSAGLDPSVIKVNEIMSNPVIIVTPETALEEAVELMFKHQIKKLPVIKDINGNTMLVGLVTLTDIARMQPKLIETLQELFEMNEKKVPRRMEKVINYYVV